MLPDFRNYPYTAEEYANTKEAYSEVKQKLEKDPRIKQTSMGLQTVRGGERLVIRAFTIELKPLERKGFVGRFKGIPIVYPREMPTQKPLENPLLISQAKT